MAGSPPLLPGAGQLPVGPELPGKLPLHRLHLDRPGFAGHRTHGTEAPRLLAEAVHADVLLAVGPLPDPEAERQFLDDRVERPDPDLVGWEHGFEQKHSAGDRGDPNLRRK